jgi:hypothetical protein
VHGGRRGTGRGPRSRGDRWRRVTGRGLDRFHGRITAAGFASGDQLVVGAWHASPLGAVTDVMWVRPDGHRILLAPDPWTADYVASLYTFDEVRCVPVAGGWRGTALDLRAGGLHLRLTAAPTTWRSVVFRLRPVWLRRSPLWIGVEDRLVGPLGGPLLGGAPGVRLAGPTPGGRHEWYSIDDHQPLVDGTLRIDGADAGALAPLRRGLGVGLSDFPTRPAVVRLVTLIEPR